MLYPWGTGFEWDVFHDALVHLIPLLQESQFSNLMVLSCRDLLYSISSHMSKLDILIDRIMISST